jgi:trk system potassium uptake protein TrkA
MYPPRSIRGRSLTESGVRTRYRVTVVGVKTPGQPFTHATQDTVISPHDLIIVSGTAADVERFAAIG